MPIDDNDNDDEADDYDGNYIHHLYEQNFSFYADTNMNLILVKYSAHINYIWCKDQQSLQK